MARFVAYIVTPDPEGYEDKVELVDMRGRVLRDKFDVMRWLAYEAPLRDDLKGRRIDVVDADEELPGKILDRRH